ncbi:MAG: AmmeMemoRadiSam system protein B [Gammaproteobacteria bacterium]|nr:AmmeMemoRadiSam system protein B [Gammaproteobacteria bacterium]
MATTRQPAVAGMFYPADPTELREMVEAFLAQAEPQGTLPKAIISPHAGFIYSGPIAASAYARLHAGRKQIKRVVLLGPSHRVPFRGLATSDADVFRTPLGEVPIDHAAADLLHGLPQLQLLPAAHASEHSLEVQLPFLQLVLEAFKLVPLVVGDATGEEVAAVLRRLWGGPETLIVISSDLSHYHDYLTAQQMDRSTSEAIVALHPEAIGYEDACGRIPVQGLLNLAKREGLEGELIDLRNSGDTAGSRDQVVGYGAYAFYEKSAA